MNKAEKYIKDYTRKCSNESVYVYKDRKTIKPICTPWLTPDDARSAVEIAKEEIYDWLLNHNDYITINGNITYFDMEKCVNDLKQTMKDE